MHKWVFKIALLGNFTKHLALPLRNEFGFEKQFNYIVFKATISQQVVSKIKKALAKNLAV